MTKKPYRYEIKWCSAELSLDAAQSHYDLIWETIASDRGFPQGGLVQQMPVEDVVSESPLADALTK